MRWKVKYDGIVTNENLLEILLKNRGIEKDFIHPYTIEDLSNPMEIYDMQKAVDRIDKAIQNKEKIYIHGDFDVDGTAATAILWSYLYREKKADVMPYIPHRVDEGYGLSKKTLNKIIDDGSKLIITVDCGIKDIELTEYCKSKGVDIIISDHHEFVHDDADNPVLPDTIVIHGMHPKAEKKSIICGGVTAWKIICAIEYTYTGYGYNEKTIPYIDLAAITTLSDIMPLKDENRVIVDLGLQYMRGNLKIADQDLRIGLQELCKVSKVELINLDTYHIGFVLGPRLNAPGRVENSAMNSLRLLCTDNKLKAQELAIHLDGLNKKRQDMTEKYIKEVISQIDLNENGDAKSKVIVAYGENWPEGIVGLVAGKIAEKYYRPTFIMSHNIEEKKVTGSARSIKNFHAVKALDECKEHLSRYGGHYMAAGFSLIPEKIEDFKTALLKVGERILTDDDIIPELSIDCILSGLSLTINTVGEIKGLSPFGYGNATPVFASENVVHVSTKLMGTTQQHVKHTLNIDGIVVDGIIFNSPEKLKNLVSGEKYKVAFTLDENEWNGKKTVQLMIKDIVVTD
ncbi:MAG: single-stranded-DNA-specific exonuclease RecJ [bacterium]